MISVLKKDFRVYRPAIIGSVLLMLCIYGLAFVTMVAMRDPVSYFQWRDHSYGAASIGLWINGIMAAVYGAAAFTIERRERSADFLAMLPIRRRRIVASKIIACITGIAIPWIFNVAVLVTVGILCDFNHYNWGQMVELIALNTAMSVMAFGVAWLLSTFLNSAAICFGIAVASVIALAGVIFTIADRTSAGEIAATVRIISCATSLGVVAFLAGVFYYLRRIEP